MTKKCI